MKLSHFFAVIAFAVGAFSVQAQTTNSAPINTIPEGITTFHIPATGIAQTSTSYFSAPLCNDPVYTGAVESLSTVTSTTPDTITVGDSPAPWTAGQFAVVGTPYFVKFLSGAQTGRVIQIVSNTTSSLTLDTTDGTQTQTTALNATSFTVSPGDTFEVFAGDTLALMFGSTTATLVINGGGAATADTVSVFNRSSGHFQAFYFNSTSGFWVQSGGIANVNNTVIYPYAAFLITRHQNQAASSFVLTGRVAEVSHLVQTAGVTAVYDSTGYPVDVKLSDLKLNNWTKATIPTPPAQPTVAGADTIAIWDATNNRYDTYFELTDSSWRRQGGDGTDQRSFVIPAGTTVSFLKRSSVTGSASYLVPELPYSLTN